MSKRSACGPQTFVNGWAGILGQMMRRRTCLPFRCALMNALRNALSLTVILKLTCPWWNWRGSGRHATWTRRGGWPYPGPEPLVLATAAAAGTASMVITKAASAAMRFMLVLPPNGLGQPSRDLGAKRIRRVSERRADCVRVLCHTKLTRHSDTLFEMTWSDNREGKGARRWLCTFLGTFLGTHPGTRSGTRLVRPRSCCPRTTASCWWS